MTHLPFIAASYAVAILVPAGFAVAARLRLARARARLRAVDPRFMVPGATRPDAAA